MPVQTAHTPSGRGGHVSEEFSLSEAIYHCRAMRRIKSDEVPEELLIKLVDAARQAPSGSNTQNSRWIIVRDPAIKRQLADQNRKNTEPYIRPQLEGDLGTEQLSPEKHRRLLNAVVWQIEHMHEIPALIVACFDYPAKVEAAVPMATPFIKSRRVIAYFIVNRPGPAAGCCVEVMLPQPNLPVRKDRLRQPVELWS